MAEELDDLAFQDVLRGKFMGMLLANGMRRQEISSEDLVDPVTLRPDLDDVFVNMLVWLRDEGFIRYGSIYGGTNGESVVEGVAPTSRAMSLLDQKIDGDATGRDLVKSDSDAYAKWGKFGAFIGGFVGAFTQSL